MAVATPVATALLATLESGQFPTRWQPFALIAAGAFVSYLVKNYFSGEKKEPEGPPVYRSGNGYSRRDMFMFLVLVMFSTVAVATNTKPTAVNDTFPGPTVKVGEKGPGVMNVLRNDKDPEGDKLSVTKFNGISFKAGDSVMSITLKDTGTFYLTNKGNYSYLPWPGFSGTVKLTYYVNDGKSSTAARQTGTIVHTITGGLPTIADIMMYGWKIRPKARIGCQAPQNGKYMVTITVDTLKLDGYAIQETKVEDGRDAQGIIVPGSWSYPIYTLCYLEADKKTMSYERISQQDYQRIVAGGCQ